MCDYRSIFKSSESQNWFKCCLAVRFAREGLVKFVEDEIDILRHDIIQHVTTTNKLQSGATCTTCTTHDITPAKLGSTKLTGKPCPNGICDTFRNKIESEHRFIHPSWRNTNVKDWLTNAWEVAKCYMPPDGYRNIGSADDTDFNGIINVLINCKHFEKCFTDDLTRTINICTKTRTCVRNLRHNARFEVDSATTKQIFGVLLDLLNDSTSLQRNLEATEARKKIKQLNADSITTVTSADIAAIIDEAIKSATEKATEQFLLEAKTKLESLPEYMVAKDEEYHILKKDLHVDLVSFYSERLSTVPLSPVLTTVDETLARFYVPPKLSYSDSTFKEGTGIQLDPITTYNEIFTRNGEKRRNIYIQGEPGTGKSTLCIHLTSQWCNMHAETDKQTSHDDQTKTRKQTTELKEWSDDNQTLVRKQPAENNKKYTNEQTKIGDPRAKAKVASDNDNRARHAVVFSDAEVFEEFAFLFVIVLRDSRGLDCHVEDMIMNQIISKLGREDKYSRAFLGRILDEEKCLIILDGLDEWSHPEVKHNSCRGQALVPHRKLWKSCTFVTTTRPWKMTAMQLRDSEIDSKLEIDGISDHLTLISKVVKCLDEKFNTSRNSDNLVQEIENHLKSNNMLHFLEIPIVLMQFVCLWYDRNIFVKSKCAIYSNMVDMMFGRPAIRSQLGHSGSKTDSRAKLPHCFNDASHCQEYTDFMMSLSNLAFHTLVSQDQTSNVVFDQSVVRKCLSSTEEQVALKVGILSQHKSTQSLTKPCSTYNFLHKTFQEFFAALYIATNPSETVTKELFAVYGKLARILDISEMFVFVCGMNEKMSLKMSEIIGENLTNAHSLFDIEDTVKQYQRMILAGFAESADSGRKEPSLAIYHVFMDFFECTSDDQAILEQLVTTNEDNILTLCYRKARNLDEIQDVQRRVIKSPKLSTLILHDFNDISSLTNTYIDLSACTNLEVLHMIEISDCISVTMNTNIIHCYLSWLSPLLETSVVTALSTGAPRLKTLEIEHCRSELDVLTVAPNLQCVLIWGNYLADNDVLIPNTVRKIMLGDVFLSLRAGKQLADRLVQVPHSVTCELGLCAFAQKDDDNDFRKYVTGSDMFEVLEDDREESFVFRTCTWF